MCNKDVRAYAKLKKIKLWQIANALNITDGNFSRKLRYEFSDDKKVEIFKIIDELAAE